ncbi:MAG: type II methionyl aminopeptidase [Thermoplasmata archaeon]
MNEEALEKYRMAGKIASEARTLGVQSIKEGKTYLEVAEEIENYIIEKGAKPAFPVNLSTDHQAAHYSPAINDRKKFVSGSIVKLDVGVHVDGYIADTAVSVEVGNTGRFSSLIDAVTLALENAITLCGNSVPVRKIGEKIEETIRVLGFMPVVNLTGHEVRRYNLHGGKSVPNISTNSSEILNAGEVVAIEPFVSTGSGHVDADGKGNILRIMHERKIEEPLNEFYMLVREHFGNLPFSPRWCRKFDQNPQEKLNKLIRYGVIYEYSVLSDTRKGLVAQAEHTVIIHEKGCEVTTR